MENFKLEDIYYMTQYDSYVSDEGIVEFFNDNLKQYTNIKDKENYKQLINIISQNFMPKINDDLNKFFYNQILRSQEVDSLEKIYEVIKLIADKNFDELNSLLDDALTNKMYEKDILDVESFEEVVNADLKEKGLYSDWVYIVSAYYSLDDQTQYVAVNVYKNGFDDIYKNINEVYEDIFSQDYEEILEEYFASFKEEQKQNNIMKMR